MMKFREVVRRFPMLVVKTHYREVEPPSQVIFHLPYGVACCIKRGILPFGYAAFWHMAQLLS
jgi:hypothetical protein